MQAKVGADITDLNNISLICCNADRLRRTYVFARIGLKIAGIGRHDIFSISTGFVLDDNGLSVIEGLYFLCKI
jgi:hypothetical protein